MRFAMALLFAAAIFLPGRPAAADTKAMNILKKYEQRYLSFSGLDMKFTLKIGRPGAMKVAAKFRAKTRSNGQKLTKLTYPGNVKGMHILVQSGEEMYIYLPAFRRVRRFAGHISNQGFMGSGFSYDDLAMHRFSNAYSVKLLRETPRHWWLALRRRKDKVAVHDRIRMSIRKDLHLLESLQYVDVHGRVYKTQKFLKYRCKADNSHCSPMLIRVVEHTRKSRVSDLIVRRLSYTRNFTDAMFSVRHLIRSAD